MATTIPESGRPWADIESEMRRRGEGDVDWREGKTAVYVFNAGPDVERVQKEAYTMYMSENGLGPLAFPSLAEMESDVVSMALGILHAPDQGMGAMTSGGTDSITMAVKAARDFARAQRGERFAANLVLARSGHPAFEKAAQLMDIEVRRAPIDETTYEADPKAMAAATDDGTIMMVGSAPNFPHGIIDPIEELGRVAEDKNVWLHVDACVGGFIAPFVRMNGVDIPPFDFEVPAVRSMSADLHKYGFAAKGASTVLFRSGQYYEHMPFGCDEWSGAKMVTPTLAGTRPGGAIAAAWAVMNFLGIDGYRQKHGTICATRERIEKALVSLGFEILGKPQLSLVAFRHPRYDPYALWGKLIERGWFTSITTEPPSLHLMISPFHENVVENYIEDLRAGMAALDEDDSGPVPEARYN
jgi:glutamate/tyrosine decarboxylase-like PLP-dependent enzyme